MYILLILLIILFIYLFSYFDLAQNVFFVM